MQNETKGNSSATRGNIVCPGDAYLLSKCPIPIYVIYDEVLHFTYSFCSILLMTFVFTFDKLSWRQRRNSGNCVQWQMPDWSRPKELRFSSKGIWQCTWSETVYNVNETTTTGMLLTNQHTGWASWHTHGKELYTVTGRWCDNRGRALIHYMNEICVIMELMNILSREFFQALKLHWTRVHENVIQKGICQY